MDWKSIVKTVAPVLGTAIGGPLGGLATKFVADSLDIDYSEDRHEDSVKRITSVLASDTTALHKIKQAEFSFKKEMKELGIKEEQLRYQDIQNAREREIKTGDNTQIWLAYLISLGFFSLLGILMFYDIEESQKNLLNIMIGSLGTAWVSIINYYFGSSKGSSDKNRLLNNSPSAK